MTQDNTRDLTTKESQFVTAYCDRGSRGYRNGPLAAEVAGYASCRNASWRLLSRSVVQDTIRRMMPADSPTVAQASDDCEDDADAVRLAEWSRAELKRQYEKCLAKGDTANAFKYLDALNKSTGNYRESGEVDLEAVRSYSDREVQEAQAFARWRILGSPGFETPDSTPQDCAGSAISTGAVSDTHLSQHQSKGETK